MLGASILRLVWSLSILLLYLGLGVYAYIPASPVNSTTNATGITDGASRLNLLWLGGNYGEDVSYQLVGAGSNGVSRGALVHFSEENLSNDTTTTPWIALVSCDANATNASQDNDIFTEARDRGAIAALLYSLYSQRCEINPEYSDPANFEQLMDIFSTPSLSSSQFIEYQYRAINDTKYRHYDAQLLNDSASQINHTISTGQINAPGFMFATLVAANSTDPNAANFPGDNSNSMSGSNDNNGPNTSLAMIILYAITGCVSALFCVVIVSGAIRAIRHPERYGPRSGDPGLGGAGYGAQSRARGLTRAILDTFPVVKFGRPEADPRPQKDVESVPGAGILGTQIPSSNLELNNLTSTKDLGSETDDGSKKSDVEEEDRKLKIPQENTEAEGSSSTPSRPTTLKFASDVAVPRPPRPKVDTSVASNTTATSSTSPVEGDDVVPDAIGRETCPICIVDFEEGDDLRVLPCEGHHRFHQQCVDPWLLDLSASCPICRQDFHALETMMGSDAPGNADHLEPPTPHGTGGRPLSAAGARFSRYLRLARRRRGRNREGVPAGYDPTNPPMPPAPETTLN